MFNSEVQIPLHIQISKILETKMKSGAYKEKIASEIDLMNQFSVSRKTDREAVLSLVNVGPLKKSHGKGTFIIKIPPIEEWLSSLNSFTKTVKNTEMEPGSKII